MQTPILRGELICVSLLLGLQPICLTLNSELCNFCVISSTMYPQPPLSLKQRLCNRTGARAFDDYQDYKSGGAQVVRGVHNQHATFDDLRFHSESDAKTKYVPFSTYTKINDHIETHRQTRHIYKNTQTPQEPPNVMGSCLIILTEGDFKSCPSLHYDQ